jgi:predicted Zn-dependent protease
MLRLLRFLVFAQLLLLAGCDWIPFRLVSDSSVEEMGVASWETLRAEVPRSSRPELQRALDQVAAQLLVAAGEAPADWEAVVFASPDVNAFALPGNKIGVFEGLFGVIETPDQLAAVIGHEIGHLQAEHGEERVNAQAVRDLGLRIIGIILQFAEVEYSADIAAALGLGVEYGLVRPYSRGQELEADRLGLELMASAGFDPAETVELWRQMDTVGGRRLPGFLATHPAPETRIEAIEAMLPEIAARSVGRR